MCKTSQIFTNFQATLIQAEIQLFESSRQITNWKEFNEAATERFAIASKWESEKSAKYEKASAPARKGLAANFKPK